MPSCCRAAPCEEVFSSRVAAWSLRHWRRRGHGALERRLLQEAGEPENLRILEIGGGLGTLQAELLRRGAREGEVIELTAAWAPYARELAEELGVADRSNFRVHDVLAEPTGTAPADVVILNRVICCSAEGVALVRRAAELTERTLLLSYPRPSPWIRAGARLQRLLFRLSGRQFRFFVHPRPEMEAAAAAAGLTRTGGRAGLLWEYANYTRTGTDGIVSEGRSGGTVPAITEQVMAFEKQEATQR